MRLTDDDLVCLSFICSAPEGKRHSRTSSKATMKNSCVGASKVSGVLFEISGVIVKTTFGNALISNGLLVFEVHDDRKWYCTIKANSFTMNTTCKVFSSPA